MKFFEQKWIKKRLQTKKRMISGGDERTVEHYTVKYIKDRRESKRIRKMKDKEIEYIKGDIIRRMRDELNDHNLVLRTIVISEREEEEVIKEEKVKEYMEKETEKTKSEKNVVTTRELWDKYDDWNAATGSAKTMINIAEMGRILSKLGYTKTRIRVNNQEKRGYKYLKYKTESSKVKEFMEEYTEETEDVKSRISVRKLLMKHNSEYKPRESETSFKHKLNMYGYRTKTSYESGKKGINNVIEPCVIKRKVKERHTLELDGC